ncbi:hypothetical protein K0U83_17150 [bacterium]|nr:hypothetical protein [bacterium]
MAIDQRDVSSKLRFMDDRALQQYAAMHKSDPYIFPLAFQESQNRQKLRMSQQAQAGAMPQPKVTDQALAQMAPPQAQPMPEEQGIGALPAQNMQGMADGGIAGYEGYGEEPQQFGQEPVLRMAEGGIARYNGATGSAVNPELASLMDARQRYILAGADTSGIDQAITTLQARMAAPQSQASYSNEGKNAPVATPKVTPTYSRDDYSGMDRRIMSGSQLPSIQSITPPTKAAPAEERIAAPRADTGLATIAPPKAAPEQSAAQRYAEMQKEMGTGPEAGADVEWKRSQLAERMRAQSKGELEDFDKEVAARGEAFKGREERLSKREAGLSKQKDENTGLSLLEAGLAIMSTPGSLATAIGKGAQAGLKTYGAGLKDLRAAQEKMDDARDQIEEFRRNEANMTAKERRQFKSAINRTETDIEKLSLDAAEKMYGYKREDAKNVFTAATQERLTDKEIAAKKDIAATGERGANARSAAQIAATLNTPDRLVFDQLLKANGNDAVKALEAFKIAKGDKFDVRSSYADYLKAFAGKEGLTPPMSMGAYAGQFGATLPR